MSRQQRIFAFLAGTLALQVSPFAVQVLRLRAPMLMGWRMFDNKGGEACLVHYEATTADGATRRIDVADIVARGETARTQAIWHRIESERQAVSLGKRECALQPPGTEVRMFLTCGEKREGWKSITSGETDLCAFR